MLMLLLTVRFNVPASRLMSIALPPWAAALSHVLPSTVNARVPVVPAIMLTSSPSRPAPWKMLSAIVSVADAGSAPSVVTSMALPALPPARRKPRIVVAIPSVTDSALPVGWLRSGRHGPPLQSVAPGAATTTVGDPLPFRLTGIDSPTNSPISCCPASSSSPPTWPVLVPSPKSTKM